MGNSIQGEKWLDASRLTVVAGHQGSGKTEFAVNLALALRALNHSFALADLDVINPYFCSRECKRLIERQGGRLIASSQACFDAEVPSLPPEVAVLFDDPELYGVLDLGGDASGARVLARYRGRLKASGARMFCVINANRPLTDTPEKAISYLRSIEAASGLHVDGLVNNTHLCRQTRLEDIIAGGELLSEVSERIGIPVICHTVTDAFIKQAVKYVCPIFPITLYMKKPWE